MPYTFNLSDITSGITLSNGNLTASSSGSYQMARGAGTIPTGKFYFEIHLDSGYAGAGLCTIDSAYSSGHAPGPHGWTQYRTSVYYPVDSSASDGVDWTSGYLMVAVDTLNPPYNFWFGANGSWAAGADPATNSSPISYSPFLPNIYPCVAFADAGQVTANFGNTPFAYTPPDGFSALNPLISGTISGGERGDLGSLTGLSLPDSATGTISGGERGDLGSLTGLSLPYSATGTISGGERGDKGGLSGTARVLVLDDYLGLFTRQHRGKPKLDAWMTALLQPLIDTQIFCGSMDYAFDIDNAVGVQLDILGEWIGLGRNLYETYAYFRYDSGPGFGLGTLEGSLGHRSPTPSGNWSFSDDQYRHMLKAKILYNRWDGSASQAASILSYLVGATASVVTIHDSQFILLLPESVADSHKALIDAGLFNFKPAGINLATIAYFGQVFSFDNTSATCGGFNYGSLS